MNIARLWIATTVMSVCAGGIVHGQLSLPKAAVTPFIGLNGVHPGSDVRVALQVTLPEGFHVQSDRPRDPSLIPTVVTIDSPTGISAPRSISVTVAPRLTPSR